MRMTRVLVAAIATLSLAACGTTGTQTLSGESARYEINKPKMSAVDRLAFNRGVDVRWVNPPKDKVGESDDG